jgi:site-specific recombinase XerD
MLFDIRIKEITALIGIEYTYGTLKNYKAVKSNTMKYFKFRKIKDIDINQFSSKEMADMEFYFKTEQHSCTNTVHKNLRIIRTLFNHAILKGLIEKNPFDWYKLKLEKTNRGFLTMEEINVIASSEPSKLYLVRTRDIFLFQIYTGLAYADLHLLKRENIIQRDSQNWISMSRKKSNTYFTLPILKEAQDILDKYVSFSAANDRLLPVPTNQVYNSFLKQLFKECEITKTGHSHLARHSFATSITLGRNVPIESVSKMLGHTKIQTTQIYAKVTEKKVFDDMKHLL